MEESNEIFNLERDSLCSLIHLFGRCSNIAFGERFCPRNVHHVCLPPATRSGVDMWLLLANQMRAWANLLRDKLRIWWKTSNKAKICCSKKTSALFFATTFFNPQQMFLLCDKLITQSEKRQTSTQNLQRNNVARQVEGFCISYFAAFRHSVLFHGLSKITELPILYIYWIDL